MLRRFAPAVFVLSLVAAHAQMDAPPVNAEAILRELEQIEKQQKQALLSARQSALNQVKVAAASGSAAAGLYEKAIEATLFEGIKNKGGAYADWKSSKAALLRSKEIQEALVLHLRYLALSLERHNSDKPEIFVQPSLAYLNELAAADALFIKQALAVAQPPSSDRDREQLALNREAIKLKDELLNKPLTDSIFVKWLRLGPSLPKGDDWELTPGNLSGILDKNVRVALRAAKNPALLPTYELEMKFLADRVSSSRRDHDATEFNTVTRPRLQLARANDMAELGQKNRAVTEIFLLVKTYPQHPDFGRWLQRVRELLVPANSAPAEASPAEAAPIEAAATPGN
jgi:hypothetical protein